MYKWCDMNFDSDFCYQRFKLLEHQIELRYPSMNVCNWIMDTVCGERHTKQNKINKKRFLFI